MTRDRRIVAFVVAGVLAAAAAPMSLYLCTMGERVAATCYCPHGDAAGDAIRADGCCTVSIAPLRAAGVRTESPRVPAPAILPLLAATLSEPCLVAAAPSPGRGQRGPPGGAGEVLALLQTYRI